MPSRQALFLTYGWALSEKKINGVAIPPALRIWRNWIPLIPGKLMSDTITSAWYWESHPSASSPEPAGNIDTAQYFSKIWEMIVHIFGSVST
jgi:hypothetical protein